MSSIVLTANFSVATGDKKDSNMLIFALDTFDLGDVVEHKKFMKTLSESTYLRQIPNWNSSFRTILVNTKKIF